MYSLWNDSHNKLINIWLIPLTHIVIFFFFFGRPLEEEMATHSSILTWKIPWTENSGRLQSIGSQRVRHDSNWAHSSLELPRQYEKLIYYLMWNLTDVKAIIRCTAICLHICLLALVTQDSTKQKNVVF